MNLNNNPNPQQQVYNQPIRIKPEGKSKFLTFCFALIPGVGQMYQGLMKKGMSLMTMFFGVIAFSIALYFPALLFLLPIIWFYSFFDAINRMNFSLAELSIVEDKFIPDIKLNDTGKFNELLKNRHVFLGWTAIILGVYAFVALIINNNIFIYNSIPYEVMRFIRHTVPSMIIPVICIIIGVKLISGSKKKTKISLQEENEND